MRSKREDAWGAGLWRVLLGPAPASCMSSAVPGGASVVGGAGLFSFALGAECREGRHCYTRSWRPEAGPGRGGGGSVDKSLCRGSHGHGRQVAGTEQLLGAHLSLAVWCPGLGGEGRARGHGVGPMGGGGGGSGLGFAPEGCSWARVFCPWDSAALGGPSCR